MCRRVRHRETKHARSALPGPVCEGRARALGVLLLIGSGALHLACGGDDDDASGDRGGRDADAGPPTCDQRRPEPRRTSHFSAEPIRVEVDGVARAIALAPPRSASLPAIAAPQRSSARRAAAVPRAVGMRLLLITPDEERASYQAAAAALQRIGVPHDLLLSSEDSLDRDLLFDDGGACRYQGVILSHSGLTWDDGTDWTSSFSDQEWDLLAEYEQTCGAREVIWYARPDAGLGLEETGSFDEQTRETARLTDQGGARFPYLVRSATVPIDRVNGYLAAIADPVTTTPLVENADGAVLAAIHTRPDGTEGLALLIDGGPTSVHEQVLAGGIVDWVTRDVHLGKRRIYLAPQIDDVFLASALWSAAGNSTATYRIDGDDVAHLIAWTASLRDRLPPGSSFTNQLAFNGEGTLPAAHADQSAVRALRAAEDSFFWINHTWDHENLDAASQEMAEEEIGKNCDLAEDWGLTHFRCSEAVTPEITGLDNPAVVAGLVAAGVRHVVSDASYTAEIAPDNPGDNPSPNVGRPNPHDPSLLQVPRNPTNIFFNCSTPTEEVGLFNDLYRDHFGRDLTYQEVLDEDTALALSDLLAYNVDPLMFHQANLRSWTHDGAHSLYTDWIDRLVDAFTALVRLPIIGLDMNGIARVMEERAAYDRCDVTATLSADRSRIHLESVEACVVPITGLDAPEAGEVEVYGGVPTTHVSLPACGSADVAVP
jgi:hypothetical protein